MVARQLKPFLAGAAFFGFSVSALAQNEGMPFGPFTAYPTLGVSYGHESNITRSSSVEIDSTFVLVSPGVRLVSQSGTTSFTLQYFAELARYDDSSLDDYEDHNFLAQWTYDPTSRSHMSVSAEYRKLHDGRGTGTRQGDLGLLQIEPDEFDVFGIGGKYNYGAVGARGAIETELGYFNREYSNNRDFTIFRDRSEWYAGATYLHRIGPKTQFTGSVQYRDIDYDFATLDSEEIYYLAGLRWDVTAKTSGWVQAGGSEKDFDDPSRDDYSGFAWEVGAEWRPRSYSAFTLTTSRQTDESEGFSDYILREDVNLGWTHDWNSRFTSIVDFGFANEDHQPGNRDDDVNYWGVSANYRLRRWLDLGAGYKYYDRDSSIDEFNYDRSVWLLSAEIHP